MITSTPMIAAAPSGTSIHTEAFAAADPAHAFVGLPLHKHIVDRYAEHIGQTRAHGSALWTDLGQLRDDRDVDVVHAPARSVHALQRRRELVRGPQPRRSASARVPVARRLTPLHGPARVPRGRRARSHQVLPTVHEKRSIRGARTRRL